MTLPDQSITVEVVDVVGVFVKAAFELGGERHEFVVPVPDAAELAIGDRFRVTFEDLGR